MVTSWRGFVFGDVVLAVCGGVLEGWYGDVLAGTVLWKSRVPLEVLMEMAVALGKDRRRVRRAVPRPQAVVELKAGRTSVVSRAVISESWTV